MEIARIYADEQGESHFGQQTYPLHDMGQLGQLSETIAATGLNLRTNEPGYDYDWHPAPARQFVVLLDGAIEIEVSDGERRVFRGGDIFLVEDTTGKGHRSRNIEPRERRSVFILLDQASAPDYS
jgi:uncharacterized cupin superfamily protein